MTAAAAQGLKYSEAGSVSVRQQLSGGIDTRLKYCTGWYRWGGEASSPSGGQSVNSPAREPGQSAVNLGGATLRSGLKPRTATQVTNSQNKFS